jgi:hypothetical protein
MAHEDTAREISQAHGFSYRQDDPDDNPLIRAITSALQAAAAEARAATPNDEREALADVMRQSESDLASAHAEICKLQGLDPASHSWPDWSPQANTLRWFQTIRQRFGIAMSAAGKGDPTDYRAEFERVRSDYHKLCDFWSKAVTDAEAIVRPYLHSGAVFGVTPDHRFNVNLSSIPFNLVGDIARAIANCRERDTRPKDGDPLGAPLESSPVSEGNSPNSAIRSKDHG